jgi:hypothetical protein
MSLSGRHIMRRVVNDALKMVAKEERATRMAESI